MKAFYNMFRSATLKLTLSYLGIILVLSALFSLALYRVSSDQLIDNAHRQENVANQLPLPLSMEGQRTTYLQLIEDQLNSAQHQLQIRLLILNLTTLLLGGGLAYLLARRSLKPIQDAMEAQGRFTADASHELRTPLTAMRTEIEVALRGKDLNSADARDLLESNLEEVAKLEALSAGLLRLAQAERGLDPATLSRVPIKELWHETADRFATQLESRDIQLEQTAGNEVIKGDRASLIELIAILVDNAIKYSPDGSAVQLSSRRHGAFVVLSVVDHGMGINSSDIPYIFNRFYRADRSRTKGAHGEVKGYGLGLSIAKRIVDLHNGVITVDSKPGHGTTFRIKLPVQYQAKKSLLGF